MIDDAATAEPVDGRSDNIRPPDHAVASANARGGSTRACQAREQFCAQRKGCRAPVRALKHIASPPLDDEFREWKKARKRHSGLPWRQLALMASVSFGVASLVLPDSVSDELDWVLYALMAASAYAGLQRRWGMSSDD